jgi:hypothetical protein
VYATAEPLFTWHEGHQDFLLDRDPIATVGIIWSQRSIDFYGRGQADRRSMLPYRGFAEALIRAASLICRCMWIMSLGTLGALPCWSFPTSAP